MSIIKMTHTIPEYLMKKYFSTGNKIILSANDYPYFGKMLYIICYGFILVFTLRIQSLENLLKKEYLISLNCKEFIYFENIGNNKSILDIRHFHVFITL